MHLQRQLENVFLNWNFQIQSHSVNFFGAANYSGKKWQALKIPISSSLHLFTSYWTDIKGKKEVAKFIFIFIFILSTLFVTLTCPQCMTILAFNKSPPLKYICIKHVQIDVTKKKKNTDWQTESQTNMQTEGGSDN